MDGPATSEHQNGYNNTGWTSTGFIGIVLLRFGEQSDQIT